MTDLDRLLDELGVRGPRLEDRGAPLRVCGTKSPGNYPAWYREGLECPF